MMAAVSQSEDGTWGFECQENNCEWTSTGWETKKLATTRGDQHKDEHESGEPMQELAEFEGRV
jgi:hypothetical protein